MSKYGAGLLAATAMAGVTLLSGGAAEAGTVSATSSCGNKQLCLYRGTNYAGKPQATASRPKCTKAKALKRKFAVKSYRNFTSYNWSVYDKNFHLVYTVTKRGTRGATAKVANATVRNKGIYWCVKG
ncbi:peptidase inhibitor family I36 protein [Actinoallomurus sp. NPDC050550]|uniref:peptidase inhibitor family I36 protein n=1 Tax=Actinoallomurus sp. NPDC050550 TaxID=3154937 RepID=UPI0033DF9394